MIWQDIWDITCCFLSGLKCSLSGFYWMWMYDREPTEKKPTNPDDTPSRRRHDARSSKVAKLNPSEKVFPQMVQCMLINGGLLGAIYGTFNYILIPFLSFVTGYATDLGYLECLFNILYVLPMYVISRLLNAVYFQDIALNAYKQRQGHPLVLISFKMLIADTVMGIIVQTLFLIPAMLVRWLPVPQFICLFLEFLHLALLNGLYAFDYKWCNMGWVLDKRLRYVEYHWPYFLGFGLPIAVITMKLPILMGGIAFAVLFPIFIISANESQVIMNETDLKLPIFTPVVFATSFLTKKLLESKDTQTQPQPTQTNTPGKPPQIYGRLREFVPPNQARKSD